MVAKAETVSENVIQTVAARDNTDPLELPPLYNTIDPDALEVSVNSISDGNIQFEYAGYNVTVYSDETVKVGEAPATTATRAEIALDD